MMIYIAHGIAAILMLLMLCGLIALITRSVKPEKQVVRLSRLIGWIGFICGTLFTAVSILVFTDPENSPWLVLCFECFACLGGLMVLGYLNYKITYDEKGFTHRNMFGFSRRYDHRDLTAYRFDLHESTLYIGKHRVMVDDMAVGGLEFITFARKRYRVFHGGQALPEQKKPKHDLFNGNVYDAGGFIFVYIMLLVLFTAFLIGMLCYVLISATPQNKDTVEVILSDHYIEDDDFYMTDKDGNLYCFYWFEKESPSAADPIISLCDGKTRLTLYGRTVYPDDRDNYFAAEAIYQGSTPIFSFAERNHAHRSEFWPLILAAAGFELFILFFVVGSVIVGRNPQKYSRKVIRMFFKEGYVKTDYSVVYRKKK